MVQSDMAVKNSRILPINAKDRAVHEQALRFGRRVLKKRSNRPLTWKK
jgi:hypothetical protein